MDNKPIKEAHKKAIKLCKEDEQRRKVRENGGVTSMQYTGDYKTNFLNALVEQMEQQKNN